MASEIPFIRKMPNRAENNKSESVPKPQAAVKPDELPKPSEKVNNSSYSPIIKKIDSDGHKEIVDLSDITGPGSSNQGHSSVDKKSHGRVNGTFPFKYANPNCPQKGKVIQDFNINGSVYLPANYEENVKKGQKYNVLITYHGGGDPKENFTSNQMPGRYFTPSWKAQDIYDNIIYNNDANPFIVVSLDYTYDNSNAQRLNNEVLPYLTEKYATYATGSDKASISAAKSHFAVGGFSDGCHTIYNSILEESSDYIGNFILTSGGTTSNWGNFDRIKNSKPPKKIDNIYGVVGAAGDDVGWHKDQFEKAVAAFGGEGNVNSKYLTIENLGHQSETFISGIATAVTDFWPKDGAKERSHASKPAEVIEDSSVPGTNPELKRNSRPPHQKTPNRDGNGKNSSQRLGNGTYLFGKNEIPEMEITVNGNRVKRVCQQDDSWGTEKYGQSTLGLGGCGIASMSNALACQGVNVSPLDIANMDCDFYSFGEKKIRYRDVNTAGTDSGLFPEMASQFGLECRRTNNPLIALNEMETKGAVAIVKLPGHYVTLADWDKETGIAHVMDPDIAEIQRNPSGVYDIKSIISRGGEYALVYPEGTTNIETQETFTQRSSETSSLLSNYDEIAKNGWN